MQYSEQDTKFLKALKAQGVPADQAFKRLNEVKAKLNQSQPQPQQPQGGGNPLSGIGNFLGGGVNFVNQAGGEIMRGVGNIIGTTGQIVDPVTNINRLSRTVQGKFEDDGGGVLPRDWQLLDRAGQAVSGVGNRAVDIGQKQALETTGKKESDFSTWGGRYFGGGLTDVASSVVGSTVGAGLAQKGAGLLSKFLPATKAITTAAQGGDKALTFGQKAFNYLPSAMGATQGGLATEGKLATPTDYLTGFAVDAGFAGAGKLLKGLGAKAFNKAVPATKGQRDIDVASGLDIGKSIQEQVPNIPIFGGQKGLLKAIKGRTKDLNAEYNAFINQTDEARQGAIDSFDKITENLGKKITQNPKLKIAPDEVIEMANKAKEVTDFYKNTFPQLNLKAQDQLKKDLYNTLDGYYSSIKPKGENVKNVTRAEIAKSLKENINNTVESVLGTKIGQRVKDLNQIRSNLLPAQKRLTTQSGKYSGYLTDAIAGAEGMKQGLLELNPVKAIGGLAGAVGLKKAVFSPRTMTAIGALSQKSIPKPIQLLLRNKIIGG